MVTTLRAALAFALLAGFYVIVAAVVAAAVVLDYLTVSYLLAHGTEGSQGLGKAAGLVTFAAAALLRALWVVSRRRGGAQERGVAVSAAQEPLLWQQVTELAERVGTRAPEEIRLVAEMNAAVAEDTSLLGLRGGTRRMYIGIPLLQVLTIGELRAVLGHELGHYSGAHLRLGAPVYRGRTAIVGTIEELHKHPILRWILNWYFKLFLRISLAVARRQEYEADAFAVAISGRAASGGALTATAEAGRAWDLFMDSYTELVGPAHGRPADLFGGFDALRADPIRRRELAALGDGERSPYDSHPRLPERLAAIAVLPEPVAVAGSSAADDASPATTVLRDFEATSRAVADSLWSEQVLGWPELSWDEMVARAMPVLAAGDAMPDLAVAGQRVLGLDEPGLDGALEAILRGRTAELHAELVRLNWRPTPDLVAEVLAEALQSALVERGLARWRLSWSGPADLVDAHGEPVRPLDRAKAVLADPEREVPALRALLASTPA